MKKHKSANNWCPVISPKKLSLLAFFLLVWSEAFAQYNVNSCWVPIAPWNMVSQELFPVSACGIQPANIAGITVIIHSDYVNGKVEVDRLDRGAVFESMVVTSTNYGGRGGQWQYIAASGQIELRRGPSLAGLRGPDEKNRFLNGLHTSLAQNRGWVRIDYVGTPVNYNQPYAIKSKLIRIRDWDMMTVQDKNVDLTQFGFPASRITSFKTTIISDPGETSPGGEPGIAREFVGRGHTGHENGGIIVISDKLVPTKAYMKTKAVVNQSFFTTGDNITMFDAPVGNRGFIKIDYLAAKCNEGSGYTRNFIGITTNGKDCHGNYGSGTAAFHVVETKGKVISGTDDNFAFISKPKNYSLVSTQTFTLRVDRQENTDAEAKAGIMIRSTANLSGSQNAYLYVTPTGGICFTYRTTTGGSTATNVCKTGLTMKAPYWLRLQKVPVSTTSSIKADASVDGSTWTEISPARTIQFPSTFYVGLAQTAGNTSTAIYNTSSYSKVDF